MSSTERIYQVNLEELVEDYVWKVYKRDAGFFKGLFKRRSNYIFDIRWGYLQFEHVTNPKDEKQAGITARQAGAGTSSPSGQATGNSTETSGKTSKTATGKAATDEALPLLQTSSPVSQKGASTASASDQGAIIENDAIDAEIRGLKPQIDEANKKDKELYISEYENKTEEEQSYTVTATRETTSTTRFEMQENYTLGASTNLEVNLGEIVKIGAEVSASYSLTETKAEEFSKSLTWNIDTEIRVPRWNRAKATLYVYEMQSKSNFVVETTVKLASIVGLPVTIRLAKDGREVHTEWITDLEKLFNKSYLARSSVKVKTVTKVDEDGDEVAEKHIVLTTRGLCTNVNFKNQHVKVECKEIEGAPPPAPNLTDS